MKEVTGEQPRHRPQADRSWCCRRSQAQEQLFWLPQHPCPSSRLNTGGSTSPRRGDTRPLNPISREFPQYLGLSLPFQLLQASLLPLCSPVPQHRSSSLVPSTEPGTVSNGDQLRGCPWRAPPTPHGSHLPTRGCRGPRAAAASTPAAPTRRGQTPTRCHQPAPPSAAVPLLGGCCPVGSRGALGGNPLAWAAPGTPSTNRNTSHPTALRGERWPQCPGAVPVRPQHLEGQFARLSLHNTDTPVGTIPGNNVPPGSDVPPSHCAARHAQAIGDPQAAEADASGSLPRPRTVLAASPSLGILVAMAEPTPTTSAHSHCPWSRSSNPSCRPPTRS